VQGVRPDGCQRLTDAGEVGGGGVGNRAYGHPMGEAAC
jgi:hypothetical protein